MPDLTGTALAAEIAALRPDLPIMLMSGFAGARLHERARALGIRELLRKPLQITTSPSASAVSWHAVQRASVPRHSEHRPRPGMQVPRSPPSRGGRHPARAGSRIGRAGDFQAAWAVHRCGIDQIDALIDGGPNGSYRFALIRPSPHPPAHGPGAEPHSGDLERCVGNLNHLGLEGRCSRPHLR
jgi:CheY-like chemotaxis protein